MMNIHEQKLRELGLAVIQVETQAVAALAADAGEIPPRVHGGPGDGQGQDIIARQSGFRRCPACAVVCGKKDAAARSSSKEIRAGDGKSTDIIVRQTVIDLYPVCTIIGGKKDATAVSPGKEVWAGDCKSTDISVRQAIIDLCPVCAVVCGKKDATDLSPGKEIRTGYAKSKGMTAARSVGWQPLGKHWICTDE